MRNLEKGSGKAGGQQFGEFLVEYFNLLDRHTSADAGAGSDAASPRLGRVWGIDIIGERLEATLTRFAEIAERPGMNTQPAPQLPIGIVMLNEFFRRTDHVASQRNPIEVCDHQHAISLGYSRGFCRCYGTVEPVLALTRRNNVEYRIW